MNLCDKTRLIVLSSWFAMASGILSAQETITTITAGDTVIVTKKDVQLGVRDKPMLTTTPGTEILVTEVRGNWLGGYTLVDGNKRYGWVHQNEVRLATPARRPAVTTPDSPDDPSAVAAWKKLGVKLHFDEAGWIQQIAANAAVVQDTDLVHLAGLSHLLTLDLSGQPITDQGMKHVGGCRLLQKLYLGETKISDAGIEPLAALPGLEVFACPKTKVSGAGLQQLGKIVSLQALNLGHCEIADEDLHSLLSLSQMEVLALPHTKITDAGLEHLRPLAKLRVLNLDGTMVKGPGFDNLLGLSELRMLYVRDCPVELGVTDKLDDKLPGLAIYD